MGISPFLKNRRKLDDLMKGRGHWRKTGSGIYSRWNLFGITHVNASLYPNFSVLKIRPCRKEPDYKKAFWDIDELERYLFPAQYYLKRIKRVLTRICRTK